MPDIAGESLSPATLASLKNIELVELPIAQSDPRLGPCVGRVGKFICIGLNYSDHAAEAGMKVPNEPVIFMKATSAICGPNDDVVIPRGGAKVDWEVELGVVVGTPAKYVSEADAMSYVAGYCVITSQFARLLIEYQEHPEAKSLAPDGGPCKAGTSGLLQRAHITAGEFRYVGKETDRKWEEGDDISVLEFKATEFGRTNKVVAESSIGDEIRAVGIRKTMELTKMSQHTIEKLIRREAVKRKTHELVLKAIQTYKRDTTWNPTLTQDGQGR